LPLGGAAGIPDRRSGHPGPGGNRVHVEFASAPCPHLVRDDLQRREFAGRESRSQCRRQRTRSSEGPPPLQRSCAIRRPLRPLGGENGGTVRKSAGSRLRASQGLTAGM
jgi:hypothetical protein